MNTISPVRFEAHRPPVSRPSLAEAAGLQDDTFASSGGRSVIRPIAYAAIFGGVAAAMGAAAGAAHPIVGGIVGVVVGAPLGAMALAPLGDGKGAEGLGYPLMGALIGAIGGTVAGATAGPTAAWIFSAAGALAGAGLGR